MKQNTYYGILVAMLACGWMGCNDDAKVTTDGVPENTSAACQDGKDNDGDGQVDCNDEECQDFAFCASAEDGKENTLSACQDEKDNDGDGQVDCDDEDCKAFAVCQAQETGPENTSAACQDGKDNDRDGQTDCDDPECQDFAFCASAEDGKENTLAACQDEKDNDGDGQVDCDDEDCKAFAVCQAQVSENTPERCQDGKDNDGDGKADCDDEDCKALDVCMNSEVTLSECTDGKDNDGDGKTDCDDPKCLIHEVCADHRQIENTPALCSDGYDNDGNGKVDCDELGCKALDICLYGGKAGEQSSCNDGLDSDGDGLVDCEDPECVEYEFCRGKSKDSIATEETCKDGLDNDGDGYIDCADADCQKLTDVCVDACPKDPYKFVVDECPCGETWVYDEVSKTGECYINIATYDDWKKHFESGAVSNKKFILKDSIDFGERNDWPEIELYNVVIDGNYKRLSGTFHLDGSKHPNGVGLFNSIKQTESGTEAGVKKLLLSLTLNVNNFTPGTRRGVGGLAGYVQGEEGSGLYISDIYGAVKVYVNNLKGVMRRYIGAVGGLVGAAKYTDFSAIELRGNTTLEIEEPTVTMASDVTSPYSKEVFYVVGGLVGSLVGENSSIREVSSYANVTVKAKKKGVSGMSTVTEIPENNLETPPEFAVGGIVGTTDGNIISVVNRGNVNVDTESLDGFESYGHYYYISASNYVGGIAGRSRLVTESAYTGDISVESSELESMNSKICVGGISGTASASSMYNRIYVNAALDIHFMTSQDMGEYYYEYEHGFGNTGKGAASRYYGGIVGCLENSKESFIVNSYAKTYFTASNSYYPIVASAKGDYHPSEVYVGGIANVLKSSSEKGPYFVNNTAYTVYPIDKWPRWVPVETLASSYAEYGNFGGIEGTSRATIVNNFVAGGIRADLTLPVSKEYLPRFHATNGKFLYESYWNEEDFGATSGAGFKDGSAKMFVWNASNSPIISNSKEFVLDLLSYNSGHNGGVLSANIPKLPGSYASYVTEYLDWKTFVDDENHQIPVPDFSYVVY